MRNLKLIVVTAVVVLAAGMVQAEVNLRFTPADTTVDPGSLNRMSVMIDDPDANVRTIDVYVTYDPAVVGSITGGAGAKYVESGFFVFQGIENDVPGQWHGYAVVLGSEDFLEGPGELFYWQFEGLADGTTPVVAAEVYVAAGDGTYYPDVLLESTSITVYDPLSAVDDLPPRSNTLQAWPNPFNPRTLLHVSLPEPGESSLVIYDLLGRQVKVLHQGQTVAGAHRFAWDGRNSFGLPMPAGQYFARFATESAVETLKLTLVK